MHKLLPTLLFALGSAAPGFAQPDATAVYWNPFGAGTVMPGSNTIRVSDRLYPYGFALDYCLGQVTGAMDNSGCLQSALNATGVNFQSLEIQPPLYSVTGSGTVQSGGTELTTGGTFSMLTVGDVICIGSTTYVNCPGAYYTVTFINASTLNALMFTPAATPGSTSWSFTGTSTQYNYYCSALGSTPLVWNPTATGRVHVWKGANLSGALPQPDSMHVIVDDNVQPINPFTSTALPAGTSPLISFTSYNNANQHINTPVTATGSTDIAGTITIAAGHMGKGFIFAQPYRALLPACSHPLRIRAVSPPALGV